MQDDYASAMKRAEERIEALRAERRKLHGQWCAIGFLSKDLNTLAREEPQKEPGPAHGEVREPSETWVRVLGLLRGIRSAKALRATTEFWRTELKWAVAKGQPVPYRFRWRTYRRELHGGYKLELGTPMGIVARLRRVERMIVEAKADRGSLYRARDMRVHPTYEKP